MIGKHFRVAWVGNDQKVSRHYTICNVMEPTQYNAYLLALESDTQIEAEVLNSDEKNSMFFTLKNYDKSGGLSRKLFMKYQ